MRRDRESTRPASVAASLCGFACALFFALAPAGAEPRPIEVFNALPDGVARQIRKGVERSLAERKAPLRLVDEGRSRGATGERRPLALCLGSVAARRATSAATRVMLVAQSGLDDPSLKNGCGVVLDFAHPDGFDALHRLLPDARRIGILRTPGCPSLLHDPRLQRRTEENGITLVESVVEDRADVARVVLRLLERVDALWLQPCPLWRSDEVIRYLLAKALELRRPIFAFSISLVHAGALACLEHDFVDLGRQLGEAAVRVDRGAMPEELGFVPPRSHRLVVNRRVARLLKLPLPRHGRGHALRLVED